MSIYTMKGIDLTKEETMLKTLLIAPVVATPWLLMLSGPVAADDSLLRARLDGFGQVPPVISTGMGKFQASINPDKTVSYTLKYSQLEETGAVIFADIHFGQKCKTGGIIVFLCANVPMGAGITVPAGTQMCPSGKGPGATIRGTITPSSIVGPAAQGIGAMDQTAALEAIRIGPVYAQVHTALFTGGEIRGQIDNEGESDQDADRRR
jgi:hypothetical protein